MYSKIFLRLEPLGIELIAAAARRAGHDVRLIDLQVEPAENYRPAARRMAAGRDRHLVQLSGQRARGDRAGQGGGRGLGPRPLSSPAATARRSSPASCSTTATARSTACSRGKARLRSARCSRRPPSGDRARLARGARRRHAGREAGRRPAYVKSLDDLVAARDLLRHRRKYFIGVLDPCASIEFSRGCPWDCSFCSAWTFYGRSYRIKSRRRGRRRAEADPRARRLHRRRRRVHPGRARHGDRRGDRPRAASRSSTTSKPAATSCCATRRSSGSGRRSASSTCSWASRRSTKRASSGIASA